MELLIVYRYYVKHTIGSYEKRVSWIECDNHQIACYEYKGSMKIRLAHGNSTQNKDPYVRLKSKVLERMKKNIFTKSITEVYDEEDIVNGPRSMQQVSLNYLQILLGIYINKQICIRTI